VTPLIEHSKNRKLEGNIATARIGFGKCPPEINGTPDIKCSAVGSILVRNMRVDCTAVSIQCI
jgi:hypothetical protein